MCNFPQNVKIYFTFNIGLKAHLRCIQVLIWSDNKTTFFAETALHDLKRRPHELNRACSLCASEWGREKEWKCTLRGIQECCARDREVKWPRYDCNFPYLLIYFNLLTVFKPWHNLKVLLYNMQLVIELSNKANIKININTMYIIFEIQCYISNKNGLNPAHTWKWFPRIIEGPKTRFV